MKCNVHHDLVCHYKCATCGAMLCKDCKPVSYNNNIYCSHCVEQEEDKRFQLLLKKEKSKSFSGKKFILTSLIILIFISAGYYLSIKPKEIKITLDDKERIQFYLTLAYNAKEGSSTYKRQMQNIFRLDSEYTNVVTFFENGQKLYKRGNYTKAIASFKKIQNMLPDWDIAYLFLARCYNKLDDSEVAKDYLVQSIELNPEGIESYMLLGDIYAQEEKYKDAILQYSKASFNDRKNSEIILHLAELYLKEKKLIKAREFREKAYKLGANTDMLDKLISQA